MPMTLHEVLKASHTTLLQGNAGVLDLVILAVILALVIFVSLKLRARH